MEATLGAGPVTAPPCVQWLPSVLVYTEKLPAGLRPHVTNCVPFHVTSADTLFVGVWLTQVRPSVLAYRGSCASVVKSNKVLPFDTKLPSRNSGTLSAN